MRLSDDGRIEQEKPSPQEVVMSEYYGQEYTYAIWNPGNYEKFDDFKSIVHASEPAPDFTLPLLDGGEVTLSKLKGKPVMIEFGSIT